MSTTPFGPTDQPRTVIDNIPVVAPIKVYPTTNPQLAHTTAAKDDFEQLEFMRVRRLSVHFDRVTLCHEYWREYNGRQSFIQSELASDFRKMIGMWLPWFSGSFTLDHARIIASVFQNREVWFDGELVKID